MQSKQTRCASIAVRLRGGEHAAVGYTVYAGFATCRVRYVRVRYVRVRYMFATRITEFATYHNRVRYLS